MSYPPYTVHFQSLGELVMTDAEGKQVTSIETEASHTLRLASAGRNIQAALTHRNEDGDTEPFLIVTFTSVP